MTSEFEDEERQLDIVLPSATSAVPMTSKPREVVVDINADGTVFLRGKATPLKELELLLQKAVASNPTNQTVVIRADQNASFQPVVNVMDVCNRTGVSDYSVSTKDGPAG